MPQDVPDWAKDKATTGGTTLAAPIPNALPMPTEDISKEAWFPVYNAIKNAPAVKKSAELPADPARREQAIRSAAQQVYYKINPSAQFSKDYTDAPILREGWGLSKDTKASLGVQYDANGNRVQSVLSPLRNLIGDTADLAFRGYQGALAGAEAGATGIDRAVDATGINDYLGKYLPGKIAPGTALMALLEALPDGGLHSGGFTAPIGDRMTPEMRSTANAEAATLFEKGATRAEMDAWAKEKGMTPFGKELDDAITKRDEGKTEPAPAKEASPTDDSSNVTSVDFEKERLRKATERGSAIPPGEPNWEMLDPNQPPVAANDGAVPLIYKEIQPFIDETLDGEGKTFGSKSELRSQGTRAEGGIPEGEATGPVVKADNDNPAAITSPADFADKASEGGLKFLNSPEAVDYYTKNASAIKDELDQRAARPAAEEPASKTGDTGGPSDTPPPGDEPPAGEPPSVVDRLVSALNEAGKLTKEKARQIAEAKAMKAGKLNSIPSSVTGRARFVAKLKAMKGTESDVSFDPLEGKLTSDDISSLHTMIDEAEGLRPLEKVRAGGALEKILEGRVPAPKELELLGTVFPPEVTKALVRNRAITKNSSIVSKALATVRQAKSTLDLSFPGRQAWGFLGHPEFYKAFGPMFKEAYQGLKKGDASYQARAKAMQADPDYRYLREAGVTFTDASHSGLIKEESYPLGYAENIPVAGRVVTASEKGNTTFLNTVKFTVGKKLLNSARKAGVDVDNPAYQQSLGAAINTLGGRGGLGKLEPAAGVGATAFFSPRMIASRVNMLNPMWYKSLHPAVRAEVLKSMAASGAISISAVLLAKAAGAEVTSDPRSSDFGKVKVGNTRYSMFGGLENYAVLAARLATNETTNSDGVTRKLGVKYGDSNRLDVAESFFENKTAPLPNYVLRYLKGKNVDGTEFNPVKEAALLPIPMFGQSTYEVLKDRGNVPEALLMALPDLFGWGANTYSKKGKSQTGVTPETIKANAPSKAPDWASGDAPAAAATPSPVATDAAGSAPDWAVEKPDWADKPTTAANNVAKDALEGLGLDSTDSGIRSAADQKRYYANYSGVAKPGTSDHEFGDAIDVRPRKGVSVADIVSTLEAKGFTGVRVITKKHGTGPHWHVRWDPTPAPADSEQ